MKIVVAGGTGLIGSAVLKILVERGHDTVAAARSTGVDVITGKGLSEALAGADVVIDTLNPELDDPAAKLAFFEHAGRRLVEAAERSGVRHRVVLSALGADRLSLSGFFLAKLMQENVVRTSQIPYTIVRSAPFYETLYGIATEADDGGRIRLPPIPMQPVASGDVALALADVALADPANGVKEIVGPEQMRLTDLAQEVLAACEDPRWVVPDAHAPYFGTEVGSEKLVVEDPWRVTDTRFGDWLRSFLATA